MIKRDNEELRNLQEQVRKNKDDIEEIIKSFSKIDFIQDILPHTKTFYPASTDYNSIEITEEMLEDPAYVIAIAVSGFEAPYKYYKAMPPYGVYANPSWLFIGVFPMPGPKGDTGNTGNGITSVTKTGVNGLVDTYTITFDNGNTTNFNVTNGKDGTSIQSITNTATNGERATWTITLTDGTTQNFYIRNGVRWYSGAYTQMRNYGQAGDYYLVDSGDNEGNIYWKNDSNQWVGPRLNIKGSNMLVGTTYPSSSTGSKGDCYMNVVNGNVYTKTSNTSWTLEGNLLSHIPPSWTPTSYESAYGDNWAITQSAQSLVRSLHMKYYLRADQMIVEIETGSSDIAAGSYTIAESDSGHDTEQYFEELADEGITEVSSIYTILDDDITLLDSIAASFKYDSTNDKVQLSLSATRMIPADTRVMFIIPLTLPDDVLSYN